MSNETPTREKILAALNSGVFGGGDDYDLEVCARSVESLFAPHMAELLELRHRVAEVRHTTLLEAARSVCYSCVLGRALEIVAGVYTHPDDKWMCRAGPIHALLAQAQAQGEGGGQ